MTGSAKAAIGTFPLGLPPLSVADLTALLSRLPAADRAALAWTPKAVEVALQRLRDEALNAELVAECTASVFEIWSKTLAPVMRVLGDKSLLSELAGLYRSEVDRLLVFLPDAGARRSAEWILTAYVGLLRLLDNDPEAQAAFTNPDFIPPSEVPTFCATDAGGLIRAFVLLMAAVSIAEHGGDRERAAEMADLGFLDATRSVDCFAQLGFSIPVDGAAPAVSGGQHILACVEDARAALAPEDTALLGRARLRELR